MNMILPFLWRKDKIVVCDESSCSVWTQKMEVWNKKTVSFGKKYEKYQNKFTIVKQLLQSAKKLKKQLLHIP